MNQDFYKIFKVKGRQIEEPNPELKKKQEQILRLLNEQFVRSPGCISFKGCSCVDTFSIHCSSQYAYKIDIKKCYQNTTLQHIEIVKNFYNTQGLVWPGALNNRENLDVLFITDVNKSYLPTGAPTSPIIANIILSYIDYHFTRNNNVKYSRYLDDICISSDNTEELSRALFNLKNYIMWLGYQINTDKLRFFNKMKSQAAIITGINIWSEYGLPGKIYKKLRTDLYFVAKNEKSDWDFLIKNNRQIGGILSYIKSVNQNRYEKLKEYYHTILEENLGDK